MSRPLRRPIDVQMPVLSMPVLSMPVLSIPVLSMPDQDFGTAFADPAAAGARTPRQTQVVRALTLGVPLIMTGCLGWLSLLWFGLDGRLTISEMALVGITVFAFYWVVLSVATAVLGLFWRPASDPVPVAVSAHDALSIAILLPMYGEPASQTMARTVKLLQSLTMSKTPHSFALFILSDTRPAPLVSVEQSVWRHLASAHPALTMDYRHRAENSDFKSGNIRDWVVNHGWAHDAMLVLDADSEMGAASVLRMADALATDPGCGLIQTIPRVLPGATIWQQMQSFASEVYGANLGRGFALWTGAEGNFLGHNALVRTRAFAASAGLPHLRGAAPRGGVILSHDFVEAALLRRAGWGVRVLPQATDSYEETPETLVGYVRRDRRWCQGNMQHLRLLAMPGLHPVSRFHLLNGAMAYLASVWWLGLLLLWTLPTAMAEPTDIWATNPLMPHWPTLPVVTQFMLAVWVGLMLVGPKLLGVVAYLRDHRMPLGKLGVFAGSVLAEIGLSALMAPMLMVHQVRAVLRTFAGFNGGWSPHLSGRPTIGVLIRFHVIETLLGLVLLGLATLGALTIWLLPIAVCLTLAVPLSMLAQTEPDRFQLFRLQKVAI